VLLLGLSWSIRASSLSWSMRIPLMRPVLSQPIRSCALVLEASSLSLVSRVSSPHPRPLPCLNNLRSVYFHILDRLGSWMTRGLCFACAVRRNRRTVSSENRCGPLPFCRRSTSRRRRIFTYEICRGPGWILVERMVACMMDEL
jgi:hypothetical protein